MFPLKERKIGGYVFGSPTSYSNFHLGVDYLALTGTPLYAPEDGTITRRFGGKQGGNTIWLVGRSGYTYRFLHLQDFTAGIGSVLAGQLIAHTGNTGLSTGPHLHLDITKPGLAVDPAKEDNFVNPETFDWNYGIIPDMDVQERAKYEEKIRQLNTEIARVTAERDARILKEVHDEQVRKLNTEIGKVTVERDAAQRDVIAKSAMIEKIRAVVL